jgi:hypothetical protein
MQEGFGAWFVCFSAFLSAMVTLYALFKYGDCRYRIGIVKGCVYKQFPNGDIAQTVEHLVPNHLKNSEKSLEDIFANKAIFSGKHPVDENKVLHHLVESWNAFILFGRNRDDVNDFRFHIHALQSIVAANQIKKINPEKWVEF